jgi:hypothetical protein
LNLSPYGKTEHQRSEIAVILEEMHEMSVNLEFFDWTHTRRSANIVAHLCAKHVSVANPVAEWHAQPPSFLLSSLLSDCNQGD